MADVARFREGDRAQLFLVGALALAVIFVVLAVLLNTAIYTGNIATRDVGPGTGVVVEYEQAATGMADRSLRTVNIENNSNYTNLETTFNDTVSIWSDRANTHSSAALADAHVSVVETKRGTKIGQNGTRNFTDDNNSRQWTVANNTTARAFQMTVEQGSLGDDDLFADDPEFAVEFADGGEELTLYIYNSGTLTNDVTVVLYDDGTEVSECSVSAGADDRVSIDFSAATLAGEDCDALEELTSRLPPQYTVTFENGTYAEGNYSLIVDRPINKLETGADDAAGGPYAAWALYSAELSVTYQSSVIYYRTNVRLAPEELDA
jgi:hypothetical protein